MGKKTGLRSKDIVLTVSLLSGDKSEGAYLMLKKLSTHCHSLTYAPRCATKVLLILKSGLLEGLGAAFSAGTEIYYTEIHLFIQDYGPHSVPFDGPIYPFSLC